MTISRRLAEAAFLILTLPSAMAGTVLCDVDYGGTTTRIEARPAADAYTAPTTAIGTYFLLRIVLIEAPSDLASIKIYTYARDERSPVPIHVGAWRLPKVPGDFTGHQFVYEPVRDGELQYRCRWEPGL